MHDLSLWASSGAQGRGGKRGVLGGAREGDDRSEEGVKGEEECELRGVR
jgi:hypothetical protein